MLAARQGLLWLCVLGLILQGCAHKPRNSENSSGNLSTSYSGSELVSSEGGSPIGSAAELESIPIEMNPLVDKWIAYFQGRGRPHMERYLSRMNRYEGLMKKILKDNGLPEDLIYIALIESGFNARATSHAAAVGYWQFIRSTGRRYNLEINPLVDERRDPVLSTQAAADYFKGLYSIFGSWYLAMASYNVGEGRVKREVMRNYTRDFWELARRKRLPKETINYVPKYLAAKLIGKNPQKYGFTDLDLLPALEFDTIEVEQAVNLKQMAEKMNLEYDDLKQLNPKFRGEVAPLKDGKLVLRVPVGQTQAGLIAARSSIVEKVEYVADAGDTMTYRVQRGDTLSTIAKKYRTTVVWLRNNNELKKGRVLRVGQRLQVPDRSAPRRSTVAKTPAVKPAPVVVAQVEKAEEDQKPASTSNEVVTAQGVFYIVQPGDTLSEIANEYSSSVLELRRMNKLRKGSVLRVGMRLKVPKDEALPATPDGGATDEIRGGASSGTARTARASGAGDRVVASENKVHVVRPGENLTTIARRHGVSVKAIREANRLKNGSVLRVGARIVIPVEGVPRQGQSKTNSQRLKKTVHVVKPGENLTQIASRYRVPLHELKQLNDIESGSVLFVGSRLVIPE
jgi:membrane-bound lytic murein transglycosylase D